MKRIVYVIIIAFTCSFYGQQFYNVGFENTSCTNDCSPQNNQMSCVDGWYEFYVTGYVPLQRIDCEPDQVCSGDNSILLAISSGTVGSFISTENPFYQQDLNGIPPVVTLNAKQIDINNDGQAWIHINGSAGVDTGWGVHLGKVTTPQGNNCDTVSIILDLEVVNWKYLVFWTAAESGSHVGGFVSIVDDISHCGPLVEITNDCKDVTISMSECVNSIEEYYISASVSDSNGNLIGDFDSENQPLNFSVPQEGNYIIDLEVYSTVNGEFYLVGSSSDLIVECCTPDPITITAEDQQGVINDITNTLTYTIHCGESCVILQATNLENATYDTHSLILTDSEGLFCLPADSTINSFIANITGMDSCGNPYSQNITVTIEQDCSNDTNCMTFDDKNNLQEDGNCGGDCDDNQLDNWGTENMGTSGYISYSNTNSIDGANDYYLRFDDGSCSQGGSFIFNHHDFAGNWLDRGCCFTFDVNLFNAVTGTHNGQTIMLSDGTNTCNSTIRATFVLNTPLTSGGGWVQDICAPIALSYGGVLPGNANGQWVINTGSAADWDALIQNVGSLAFYVDVASGDETWGLDNLCFESCDCDEFNSADFSVSTKCFEGTISISVDDFDLYGDLNATHEWYILSSPNQNSGPYTPVYSTSSTDHGPIDLITGLPDNLFYLVVHKVITEDCGELCFAQVVYCGDPLRNNDESKGFSKAVEIDCCLVFEYWPNGPGDPMEFSADFDVTIFNNDSIQGVPIFDYSNNPDISHEWVLLSSPNPDGGPYSLVDQQTGDTYEYGPISSELCYFLIHRVRSECGDVCFGKRTCYNAGDKNQKAECELCGPVNCSSIEVIISEPCGELTAPTNLQVSLDGAILSWDPVPDAVGYIVKSPAIEEIDCNCQYPVSILPIETATNSITLPESLINKCFVWEVIAICGDGTQSAPSQQACHSSGRPRNAIEIASITPNPTDGILNFNIQTTYDSAVTVEMYDLFGVRIKTLTTNTTAHKTSTITWNGSRLVEGVYFVIFKTDKETLQKRVIIK